MREIDNKLILLAMEIYWAVEGLLEWLKHWGALLIAFLALAQPWLVWLWKSLFHRGKVTLFLTHYSGIEIGFGPAGPFIDIQGTLIASERDLFVRTMTLEVVRAEDNSTRSYFWSFFRSPAGNLGSGAPLEVPNVIRLVKGEPHRFNIVFTDGMLQQKMMPLIQKVRENFLAFNSESRHLTEVQMENVETPAIDYGAFLRGEQMSESGVELDRLFYFLPGVHSLKITVHTTDRREFSFQTRFELAEDQVNDLRNNRLQILDALTGQQMQGSYFVAYPIYELI